MNGEHRNAQRGFVDAHVHIQDAAGLRDAAAAGIVAVRDAGTHQGAGLRIKAAGGQARIPFVLSAGRGLYKKGGYGSLFGVSVEMTEEIKAEILALTHAGAGIIKTVASGVVSLKKPGSITQGGFDGDELAFIVKEAGGHGLGVMVHANGEQAVINAAHAGARSIEHGFFMTREALNVMAKAEVFWVPTVGALLRAAESATESREAKDFIAGLIRSHLDMINYAYAIGVPLAIGTDCVLPAPDYRAAYETELAYFEQAGISRDEVMMIACKGGAKLLGLA